MELAGGDQNRLKGGDENAAWHWKQQSGGSENKALANGKRKHHGPRREFSEVSSGLTLGG